MKLEKVKQWFKDHGGEIVCTAIVAGTAVGAYWLGDKVCTLKTSIGLQQFIERDKVMALTKPRKDGEPIVEIGVEEWLKMMKDRKK